MTGCAAKAGPARLRPPPRRLSGAGRVFTLTKGNLTQGLEEPGTPSEETRTTEAGLSSRSSHCGLAQDFIRLHQEVLSSMPSCHGDMLGGRGEAARPS